MCGFKKYLRCLLSVLIVGLPAPALAQTLDPDAAKALNIIKFIPYIEWPTKPTPEIEICFLGGSNVKDIIGKLAASTQQPLKVTEEKSWKSASSHCNIVYISDSEESKLDEILGGLKTFPILTVSDIANFADHGGMIGFTLNETRMRFVINTRSIKTANIHVGGQMLQVALERIDK